MGTSSSHTGPKMPLLPENFDTEWLDSLGLTIIDGDLSSGEEVQDENKGGADRDSNELMATSWRSAKVEFTRYVTGHRNNTSPNRAIRNYVKAYGGARKLAASSRAGIITLTILGGFLNQVSRNGITQTLQEKRIEFAGRPVKEIIRELIELLSTNPNTKEDAVAKEALGDTMVLLIERMEENDDINSLDEIIKKDSSIILEYYVSSYIYRRIISDMFYRIEKHAANEEKAIVIEKEIRLFVSELVKSRLADSKMKNTDFTSASIRKDVFSIYESCFSAIEGLLP